MGSRWISLATVLAGAGLLGLSGCLHYQPEHLDPVATARRLAQRSLADPGLKAYVERNVEDPSVDWPPSAWGLTQLSLAAFYFHPDLDVARAAWTEARSGELAARQRPGPSVSVGPGRNTTTSTPSPWILTSFLDLTVETAGKRGVRRDQAHHLAEAARLHLAAVAWQVRSGVRRSMTALHAGRETRRLLELQQELHEENVRRIEQRFAAGAVSAYERTLARLAAEQSRLAWRDADRQAAEAQVRLAAAVGISPEALDGIPLAFDELATAPSDTKLSEARTLALTNRADLLEALAEYAAREAALRLEVARQYPDLHIGPGYEFDQGDNKWSLGLAVSLPSFHGNRGAITRAEARRTEAAARFEALQLRVVEEAAGALAGYRGALEKKAAADAMLEDAREQVRRAESLLAAGELSEADLVAVRLETSAASVAHLSASSEVEQALGALEDALQSPLGLPPAAWQEAPRAAANEDR